MNTKNYLIILGASFECLGMYHKAKAMGLQIIGIDYNPDSVAFEYADIPIVASAKHADQVIDILDKLKLNYIGIVQTALENSITLQRVAEHYNLISVSAEVAMNTTDKVLRYRALEGKANIPKFYRVVEKPYESKLKYPYILKPSMMSGSRGVCKINNDKDLDEFWEEVDAYNQWISIEEIIHGKEISIEGFVVKGKLYITGFNERLYKYTDNRFIELGSMAPTTFTNIEVQIIINEFDKAVKALNITDGPTKGDMILSDGVPYIIEVTSRLAGAFGSKIQPLNNGTDIETATLQWILGREVDVNLLIPKFNKPVVHLYYLHKAGVVKNITIPELDVEHVGINYMPKDGDELEDLQFINRILYVITTGDTVELALERAKRELDKVVIEYHECDYNYDDCCSNCPNLDYVLVPHPGGYDTESVEQYYCKLEYWEEDF